MSDEHHVYKHIRLTGTSGESLEDAVNSAVARAARTVRNLRWFQVVETRGHIRGDRVDQWQVTVEIGFNIEE
jgi:flavin-binding protein dodecin